VKDVITIDFETTPIRPRPHYPPQPVGCSFKVGDAASRYVSFGHPAGNWSEEEIVRRRLVAAWETDRPLLFHNAKFDLAVCYEYFGLPELPWDRVHDTMFLAFLADPHSKSHGLKDLAADLLDWPAEERDGVAEYIWENRKALIDKYGGDINKEAGKPQANKSSTGEWLCRCPANVVAPYAEGDTDRTYALFQHLYPLIVENGMLEAYNRERQILPIFMENERLGIRVDVAALERDIIAYKQHKETCEGWLRKRLGVPDLNLDADEQVAEALSSAGIVDDDKWVLTKKRKRSVSKANLKPEMYNDPQVASAFGYRNRLQTCLAMFMETWLAQARETGGTIHTNWNQTRGGGGGTRTGRPSTSNPNILNISKTFEDRGDGYKHPDHLDVSPLPFVRRYVLPDEGHVFVDIDFSGQEMRIFANIESGDLATKYREDPNLDPHQYIANNVAEITGDPTWSEKKRRTLVKNINFGKLYGAGLPRIKELMSGSEAGARELSAIHAKALPGLAIVNEEIKRAVRGGDPVRTWGGRAYFPELPAFSKKAGRHMNFEYKLINYVVQGGAACLTKQTIIDWYNDPRRNARFLATVYDEICISAPAGVAEEQLLVLKEIMERDKLDVPMRADPAWGPNWHDVKAYTQ
jgi:DNA polymerase I-like protein with 3'-5' exonuclease and polymerase domains